MEGLDPTACSSADAFHVQMQLSFLDSVIAAEKQALIEVTRRSGPKAQAVLADAIEQGTQKYVDHEASFLELLTCGAQAIRLAYQEFEWRDVVQRRAKPYGALVRQRILCRKSAFPTSKP